MIPQFNPLSSFYPLSLFANGEPGFWLDPSDFSTMYQTSDGVTPVTAVEQPVGLILDKSQGLVLGSELVTNGDFSNGTTGWTAGVNNTLSVVSGACKSITTSANGAFFGQSFAVVAGKTYKFQFDSISDGTSLAAYACLGTANGISNRYPGASIAFGTQRTFYYLSPNTETIWIWFYGGVGQPANNYILIDNVSCKSLAGAHYYQSTAGVRPVLSGRVNGISKTENLAVSPWIKTGGITSATATTAPDGTSTAFAVLCAANSTAHQMYQLSVIAGTQVTNYVIAKQGTVPWLAVNFDSSATVDGAFFNLATGTKGTVAAGTTATIDPHPLYSGWYICTVTRTYTSANHYFGIEVHTADNQAAAYAAAGTETVLVWHPDLRPTDQATGLIPTYQRVNTSTDYDTAGFPLYLSSNGTQWMQCATQDYTGVNKIMICAGVRKISDAALAVVFELSPTIASNNGAVLLSAPNSAAANLNFSSKGTTQVDNVVTTYTSPNTTVLTGLGDISAPSNIVRVNGAQVGSVLSTQGTGNYGNYAGFLFARNGASSMLTGNIYGLVGRGSTVASNAAQISQTELWTNNKTKAY